MTSPAQEVPSESPIESQTSVSSAPESSEPGLLRLARGYGLATSCAVAVAATFPIDNPDTFGHLAQGREIAALGSVPQHDSVALGRAAGTVFHNYEWLSDWALHATYDHLGPSALIALNAAVLAIGALLLCALAGRLSGPRGSVIASLLIVAAIPASRFRFSVRPHTLALGLSAAYLHGLCALSNARLARGAVQRWLAGLGVLHVLWVNVHGSHLLGCVLTLCFLVGGELSARSSRELAQARQERRAVRRRLLALLALQAGASAISPYGPAIVLDAVAHVADPAYRALVSEWQPWQPTDPPWLMLAPLLQVGLLLLHARRLLAVPRVGLPLALVAAVLSIAAFRSIRFVAELMLIGSAIAAIPLAMHARALSAQRFRIASAFAAVAVATGATLGAAQLPPHVPFGYGVSTHHLPAAIGAYLREQHPAPKLLAAPDDAWYLRYALPDARVVIDGRIPFYGPMHVQRVRAAFTDEHLLQSLLDEYAVDTVVLRHGVVDQAVAVGYIHTHPQWVYAVAEDNHALYLRANMELTSGARPRSLGFAPGYGDPGLYLAAEETRARALREAIADLPDHDNTRGYRGWVQGLLALRPLLRAGPHDGLRTPRSAADLESLKAARSALEFAAKRAESVPIVHAYLALAQIALCELEAAGRSLQLAAREGASRETMLGSMELALRRGELASVDQLLTAAEAHPESAADPWLAALRTARQTPPACSDGRPTVSP